MSSISNATGDCIISNDDGARISAGVVLEYSQSIKSAWLEQQSQGNWRIFAGHLHGEFRLSKWFLPLVCLIILEWSNRVVGIVSDWSVDKAPFKEQDLVAELNWASYLSLAAIIIPLKQPNCFNLASMTNPFVHSMENIATWIQVPTTADASTDEESTPWHWWNTFRSLCTPCTRMGVALDISADICSKEEQDRWLGEPIRCVIVSADIFLTNAKGFPVLSRAHQSFIKRLLKLNPHLIISDASTNGRSQKACLRYLNHLSGTLPIPTVYEQSTIGYNDFIEIPLQPLMDHLESQTYEVFEKDPVKYDMYEKAMYTAFCERRERTSLVVMVVGAGRGPLVRRALSAAQSANVTQSLTLIALEKNPGAIQILQHFQRTEWKDCVRIVAGDMRTVDITEKADILVSELLGSWGDNELSPECLDGAQRLLADDGISIPYRSRSFVAPISTHKNYTELRTHKDRKHLETPYVVLLTNFTQLGPVQELFEFTHPHKSLDHTNNRFRVVEMIAEQDGLLHGFAGFFDSHLFGDIFISIHPDSHTPDMFSWFPMYIPISTPIFARKGDVIRAAFWRKTSATKGHSFHPNVFTVSTILVAPRTLKVWYEWAVISPCTTEIHNLAGRSSFIGL
eukprot:gene5185-7029_t